MRSIRSTQLSLMLSSIVPFLTALCAMHTSTLIVTAISLGHGWVPILNGALPEVPVNVNFNYFKTYIFSISPKHHSLNFHFRFAVTDLHSTDSVVLLSLSITSSYWSLWISQLASSAARKVGSLVFPQVFLHCCSFFLSANGSNPPCAWVL